MLRTKYKILNTKYKIQKEGFTFIEMIIAISILGIMAVIAAGFLLTSLSSSGKAEINKEVRQNGNYALAVMEGLIISSKSVSCPTAKEIDVTDISGQLTQFICDDSIPNFRISSVSAVFSPPTTYILTADNVAVTNCNFTCTATAGGPTNVGIGFMVSQKTTGSLTPRPNEKSSVSFQTQVTTRNY